MARDLEGAALLPASGQRSTAGARRGDLVYLEQNFAAGGRHLSVRERRHSPSLGIWRHRRDVVVVVGARRARPKRRRKRPDRRPCRTSRTMSSSSSSSALVHPRASFAPRPRASGGAASSGIPASSPVSARSTSRPRTSATTTPSRGDNPLRPLLAGRRRPQPLLPRVPPGERIVGHRGQPRQSPPPHQEEGAAELARLQSPCSPLH